MDKVGVLTAKSGKKFCILKFSDLNKYDLTLLRKHFSAENPKFKGQPESARHCLRAFNQFGYKVHSFMVFGDAAVALIKLAVGSVVAILNPKALKEPSKNEGLSFSIEAETAVLPIGYSRDYNVCKG